MAATRKLQGEIDRCLKKVTEGVDTFEDIWQKVHNATNSNQKEKYEADLKKEIKKLQRLRDQIKSWIASAEIKDKSILMDNRKLIETQMERFKVVERETKTKAYSKEGLGAAQKLDPAQKERDDIQYWLTSSIAKLNIGSDSLESEIEQLLSNKKKKLDKDKQDRIEDLKSRLDKHKFHIRKLETLLRMLDNMSVEVQQIKNIRDNVEYYIDFNTEPDFEDNEFIYDDIIGMDEVELSGVALPSSATTDSNETGGTPTSIISGSSPPPSSSPPLQPPTSSVPLTMTSLATAAAAAAANSVLHNYNNHSGENSNDDSKKVVGKEQKYTSFLQPIKPMPVRAVTNSQSTTNTPLNSLLNYSSVGSIGAVTSSLPPPSAINPIGVTLAPSVGKTTVSLANSVVGGIVTPVGNAVGNKIQPGREASPVSLVQSLTTSSMGGNFAAVAAASAAKTTTASGESNPASVITIVSQVQTQNTSNAINTTVHTNPIASLGLQNSTNPPPKLYNEQHVQNNCISPEPNNGSEMSTSDVDVSQQVPNGTTTEKISEGMTSLKSMAQQVIDQAGLQNNQVILEPSKLQNQGKSDAHIPPLLGVAPLGAIPLQKEHQTQFQLMEAAYYHMPHPSDSERIRTYLPRSPCTTPSYYIQTPLAHSESLDFFQRLATETLFFVFYYMEGTKAQYLAAKALKKQSWRFHTKYMMWFQRHEEPKIINEEYEQGTYIYFDYEKWGQRKKEGFTFEYKYLEDRDLN
ncbi:CCR4-NOT transcription complex subunit 3 isoform X3 [Diabrotica virgifera virgifera]|uniref:CCR4-NOT transcription complex subunit 3 n=1 Tax=Diabrotica virgifera virgifera TaxID=50390 RepID=A0A6P7GBL0_DIAVI|nr:CCR4-NOT transcription complex subunit 3 isoform X3 [Diabrotica virgifera virgifera]